MTANILHDQDITKWVRRNQRRFYLTVVGVISIPFLLIAECAAAIKWVIS